MAMKTYLEAIHDGLAEEMRRDPSVFVIGEDVGTYGGAFRVTAGFLDEFGEERVIETVGRAHGAPARVVATLLVTEADSFSGPGALPDDMTVVVARRLPPGRLR